MEWDARESAIKGERSESDLNTHNRTGVETAAGMWEFTARERVCESVSA